MFNPDINIFRSLFIRAFRAAIHAGKSVLEIMNSNYEIAMKSDNSPISSADITADAIIKKHLIPTRIPILSEEGRDMQYDERKSWDIFWIVDPLDGTRQFIEKRNEFTVNIALISDGKPMFGVIYAPALKVLYFGYTKEESFKLNLDREVAVEKYTFDDVLKNAVKIPSYKDERKYTVLLSKNHAGNQDTVEYLDSIRAKYGKIEVKKIGSSLKMCLLADGCADEYPRFTHTYEWDTAAAQAVLEGAGCSIRSIDDMMPLTYNKKSLLNPFFICRKEIYEKINI